MTPTLSSTADDRYPIPTLNSDTPLLPIQQIAQQLGLSEEALIPYGHHMAKVDIRALRAGAPQGKLILVSSITPTPFGEGKTVTTIGLSQGINRLGNHAVACIRQPSLGPVFGVKGGAAGGGAAQVVPMEKLNLHLTGDIHAISAAHNLAAAALDARMYHEQRLGQAFSQNTGLPLLNIDSQHILWPRVVDHNDRALRHIRVGIGGSINGVEREDHVEITAASELMAILALSESLQDMRQRISRIILAHSITGQAITAEDLGVAGAMTALMKETIHPTLMQTSEQTPVLIHAGPFANIAHGNSSVLADRLGLQLADYVVTEAGFGSDMGMEKFFNIKYRQSGLSPSCVVLVATLRSLKANSGAFDIKPGQPLPAAILTENIPLLNEGCANLKWHIEHAKSYGLPVVVAVNRFPDDSTAELTFLADFALSASAYACEFSDAFAKGGDGTLAFILVIAVVVQFTELVVRKTSPALYRLLGIFLPLITTNCAVLGVALLNVNQSHNFMQSAVYGFSAAAGFSLVMVLFAAIRERLAVADVPAPFRGSSIALITAGLMSLAFMGFTGLVKF